LIGCVRSGDCARAGCQLASDAATHVDAQQQRHAAGIVAASCVPTPLAALPIIPLANNATTHT